MERSSPPPPGGLESDPSLPPAGWFDDPRGVPGRKRYWDGQHWTDHVHTEGDGGAPKEPKPWWKRTWVLVVAGLLILGLIGSALEDPKETATNESQESQDAAPSSASPPKDGEEAKTVGVGDAITVKGTQYRVLSARTESEVGDSFTEEEADGIFVVVRIELTNLKDNTRTIVSDAIKLVGGNGKLYDTDDDALFSVDDNLLLEQVQPDLAQEGTVVYDIPPTATSGAKLRVEDLYSDAHGFIDLDLSGAGLGPAS